MGDTATIDSVVSAVTGMAASVQAAALGLVGDILPVLAPITAAVIVANLGRRIVVRFSR